MRGKDNFQLSSLVTTTCTEIEQGDRRNRLGGNIKISVLDMFNLRYLSDIFISLEILKWR